MKFKLWLDIPDETLSDNPLMVMEFAAADIEAAANEVEREYPYDRSYYSRVSERDGQIIWNGRFGDRLILSRILEFEDV